MNHLPLIFNHILKSYIQKKGFDYNDFISNKALQIHMVGKDEN